MNTQCWKRNTSHVKFSWDTCGMRQKPMNSEKSETAYTRATHDREALGGNRQPRLNWKSTLSIVFRRVGTLCQQYACIARRP